MSTPKNYSIQSDSIKGIKTNLLLKSSALNKAGLLKSLLLGTAVALSACSSNGDDSLEMVLGNIEDGSLPTDIDTVLGEGGALDSGLVGGIQGSMASPGINLVPRAGDSSIGLVFTGGEENNNRTLYILTDGDPNTFNCDAACEEQWPPHTTDFSFVGVSGQFDVMARGDGLNQWTFKGYPLYFYIGDNVEGETNGNSIDDVWFVTRPDPITSGDTSFGETLVVSGSLIGADANPLNRSAVDGRTLYFFDGDNTDQSACNDTCAVTWPPVYADMGSASFDRLSVFMRDDGNAQWAYDGMPLYLFEDDEEPGDTNGSVRPGWTVAVP